MMSQIRTFSSQEMWFHGSLPFQSIPCPQQILDPFSHVVLPILATDGVPAPPLLSPSSSTDPSKAFIPHPNHPLIPKVFPYKNLLGLPHLPHTSRIFIALSIIIQPHHLIPPNTHMVYIPYQTTYGTILSLPSKKLHHVHIL